MKQLQFRRGASYLGCLCVLAMLFVSTGCSSLLPEVESFGAVKGSAANRSANGLGVHRKMWSTVGAKCLFPRKLSPRLNDFEVIVLVGTQYGPPGQAAREWLEEWLSEENGRTVIYFGRDFNAGVYYRQQTLSMLDADERRLGEQAIAQRQTKEFEGRAREVPESTFCGWFYMDTSSPRQSYAAQDMRGPWASDLLGASGHWPVGITLQEPSENWRTALPTWLTQKAANNPMKPANQFQPQSSAEADGEVLRSAWNFQELDTKEKWSAAFDGVWDSETLLETTDGRPLVFRLREPSSRKGSQLIVVANGAPLLNASLVDPLHRELGKKLIAECLPAKRVALLEYGNSLLVSSTPESENSGLGLAFFTAWPLGGITMSAGILGVIVCAVLLPILGRAQPLPKRSVTDFGLHVEALGRMLHDTGDIEYAKAAVREYFERVKGEKPPPWLNPVLPAGSTSEPNPNAQTKASTIDRSPVATPKTG